jgi:hypothetical protein
MSEPSRPTAFVSYSWDNNAHKKWVAELATRLRRDGIDARLDQWHAAPGDQLPHFMEREIRENHYVIVICTPNYKRKSDNRAGGVGYEGDIMTAEVFTTKNQRKFIPVLASGNWIESAPSWLAGKYFVDLSNSAKFDQNYQDLLSTIIGTRMQAPPLGPAPVDFLPPKHSQPMQQPIQQSTEVRILGVVVDEVTDPRLDGARGSALYRVPFRLSRRPSSEWVQLFLQSWEMPPRWTSMHRPGIANVVGDRIILDGTTIEEVQHYHKRTLTLCINEANKKEAEWKARVAQQKALEEQRSQAHRKSISDIASQIKFDDET